MKRHLRPIGRIFLTGLLTVLPIAATVYFVVWLVGLIDSIFGRPLKWLLPDEYLAGTGILIAVAIIFGVGVLMHDYFFSTLVRRVEGVLLKMPLVRSIYGALRDLMGLFAQEKGPALQVVSLTIPGTQWRVMGFVTREMGEEVAVYLPMSYQIGGYTLFVPKSAITLVDMSREDAMKFILTAGLKSGPDAKD